MTSLAPHSPESQIEKFNLGLIEKMNPTISSMLLDESKMGYSRFSFISLQDSRIQADNIIDTSIAALNLNKSDLGIHFVTNGAHLRRILEDGFRMAYNYASPDESHEKTIDYWKFNSKLGLTQMNDSMKSSIRDALIVLSASKIATLSNKADQSPNASFTRTAIPTEKMNLSDGEYFLPTDCVISISGISPYSVAQVRTIYGEILGLGSDRHSLRELSWQISTLEKDRVYDFNPQQNNIYLAYRFAESLALSQASIHKM